MIRTARLETAEGDSMEVRYEYAPTTWGPDGTKGYYMAGREDYWHYAKNVRFLVKLSDRHDIPLKILAEISSSPGCKYTYEYIKKQYELKYESERCFYCATEDRIVVESVTGSEQRYRTSDQYINFTLIYDNYTTPLICPINGTADFRMTLAWAEAIEA